jgi:hypothetical protein
MFDDELVDADVACTSLEGPEVVNWTSSTFSLEKAYRETSGIPSRQRLCVSILFPAKGYDQWHPTVLAVDDRRQ